MAPNNGHQHVCVRAHWEWGKKEILWLPSAVRQVRFLKRAQCILYLTSSFISLSSPWNSTCTSKSKSRTFRSFGLHAKVPYNSSPWKWMMKGKDTSVASMEGLLLRRGTVSCRAVQSRAVPCSTVPYLYRVYLSAPYRSCHMTTYDKTGDIILKTLTFLTVR